MCWQFLMNIACWDCCYIFTDIRTMLLSCHIWRRTELAWAVWFQVLRTVAHVVVIKSHCMKVYFLVKEILKWRQQTECLWLLLMNVHAQCGWCLYVHVTLWPFVTFILLRYIEKRDKQLYIFFLLMSSHLSSGVLYVYFDSLALCPRIFCCLYFMAFCWKPLFIGCTWWSGSVLKNVCWMWFCAGLWFIEYCVPCVLISAMDKWMMQRMWKKLRRTFTLRLFSGSNRMELWCDVKQEWLDQC